MRKRLLSWLLVLVMIFSLIPSTLITSAFAASAPSEGVDISGAQNLDDSADPIAYAGVYRVSGQRQHAIKVTATDSVTLVLDDATITTATSPIELGEHAKVTIVVEDGTSNTLTCTAAEINDTNGGKTAGILVPSTATLTIDKALGAKGNGELKVTAGIGGAGIGGGAGVYGERAGSGADGTDGTGSADLWYARDGWTVKGATGGAGSAGGQGGRNGTDGGSMGSLTINSGVVNVTGGANAAGIGGGAGHAGENGEDGTDGTEGPKGGAYHMRAGNYYSRLFTGGGGHGGSGAGGNGGNAGHGGNGGTVTITGGSVTVTGGANAADIGGGNGGQNGVGGTGGQAIDKDNRNTVTYSAMGIYDWGGYSGKGGAGGQGADGWNGSAGNGGQGSIVTITGGTVALTNETVGGGKAGAETPQSQRKEATLGESGGKQNAGSYSNYGGVTYIYTGFTDGGNGGNGGEAAAEPAHNTPQDGTIGTLKIYGKNQQNLKFLSETYNAAVSARPMAQDGTKLYRAVITAVDADDNVVDGAVASITYDGNTYTATGDQNGKIVMWLPEGAYTLSRTDVTQKWSGWMSETASLNVTTSDDATATAKLGFKLTFAANRADKVYTNGTDTPVTLTMDATAMRNDTVTMSVRWFREPIQKTGAANDTEYWPEDYGTKVAFEDGYKAADETRGDKGTMSASAANAKLFELPINENGRYWAELTIDLNGNQFRMVHLVEVKNIYREFQIQTRTQEMTRDGSVKFTTEYEALKNGNGTDYQASYGFPWDLHGYNSTDVTKGTLLTGVDYDSVPVTGLTSKVKWYNAAFGAKSTEITKNTAGTAFMPVTLTLNQDFLTNNQDADKVGGTTDISKYTITYTPEGIPVAEVTIRGVVLNDNGSEKEELWSYTNSYPEGVTEATIDGFVQAGYRIDKVLVNGVERTGLTNNSILLENLQGTQENNYTDAISKVEFVYVSNMTDVTIHGYVKGTTDKVFEDRTVSAEIGKPFTYPQPVVDGYDNESVTPDGGSFDAVAEGAEITFYYLHSTGNVTYQAVDADDQTPLASKTITVANGGPIDKTAAKAAAVLGSIQYYTLTGDGTAAVDTYDGLHDVTVTYTYTRNKHTLTVVKKDADSGNEIAGKQQEIANVPAGKTYTFGDTVTAVDGYTAVAALNPTSFDMGDADATVTFWYRKNDANRYATITVNSVCDGATFQSYQIPAFKDVALTVPAPTWIGYALEDPKVTSQRITPTGDAQHDTITFKYVLDAPQKFTVELMNDKTNKPLTAPDSYQTEYTLKKGDSVTIQAPAMNGFAVVGNSITTVTYGAALEGNKVTFHYAPVETANFVTHTVVFTDATEKIQFYTYDKLISKSDTATTTYTADSVKNVIAGYKLQDIRMEIDGGSQDTQTASVTAPNNKNVKIVYRFVEDTSRIVIKKELSDGTTVTDTVLSGYRTGLKNVEVTAPLVDGYALASDEKLTKSITELKSGDNEITFRYDKIGNVTFTLKEHNDATGEDTTIAVRNGEKDKTYDPTAENNPLNLSAYKYTFLASDKADVPFKPGGNHSVTVTDTGTPKNYDVYYTKGTRPVKFVAVDSAKYPQPADMGTFNAQQARAAAVVIRDVSERARIGEMYKASALSVDRYALSDQITKYYTVEDSEETLYVYFWYKAKSVGTVTVHYHTGLTGNNHDTAKLLLSYSMDAVAGEKVIINIPQYLEDGKYKLPDGADTAKTHIVTTGDNVVDINYEPNFVTVKVMTKRSDHANPALYDTCEVNKTDAQGIVTGNLTLTPPYRAGYTLVGITGVGNGSETTLPTDVYQDGKLTLTGLSADTTITYYYNKTSATEYQSDLTISYLYNGYKLANDNPIKVNRGEANAIDIPSFEGYKATKYQFTDGTTAGQPTDIGTTGISVTPTQTTGTLVITYVRTDGSIVLPGKDGEIGPAPKDADNIIVKPGDKEPSIDDKGNVTIPKDDNNSTVIRPIDPENPDKGKEEIKVPGGTVIKPDGSIVLPDNGGTINPGDKLPDATPAGYVSVVYKANGGAGDDVIVVVNGTETAAIRNPFSNGNQVFKNWNTKENGINGTAYSEGAKITGITGKGMTLYAQWGKSTAFKYSATLIYLPNDGTGEANKIEDTVGVNDSRTFFEHLRAANTFAVADWTFGGWNTAANGTGTLKAANAIVEVEADKNQTWHAQWYKVGANGSITVPGDGNPNTPDDNVTANGTGVTRDLDTGNISIPAGGNVVKGNETIVLPDGGILKPDGTIIITRPGGGTITIPGEPDPTDPSKPTKPDVTKPGGDKDTDAEIVTMTYHSNDSTGKVMNVKAVKGEKVAIIASPFKWDGYTFLNWMGTDKQEYNPTDEFTAREMEFFAQWYKKDDSTGGNGSIELPGKDGAIEPPHDKDNVIVTPGNGGTLDGPKKPDGRVEVTDGEATVTRPDPSDKTGDTKEEIKVPEGTIIYPDGTIKLPDGTIIKPGDKIDDNNNQTGYFVVTFLKGEAENGDPIKMVVKTGNINLPAANTFTAPSGKIFSGWKTGDVIKQAGDAYEVTANATFTAQFKKIQTGKAVVTFDFDGGTADGKTYETRTGDPGAKLGTLPNPTRGGYTFKGWNEQITENTLFGAENTTTTYTAQWTAKTYTIHYNGNGATGNVADQTYVFDTANAKLAQNSFTLADKVFLGWSVNKDATSAMFREGEEIGDALRAILTNLDKNSESELTLYAIWKDNQVTPSEAIAIFDFAGGKDANGNTSIRKTGAADAAITITAPTREGYTFAGWDKGEPKFGKTGTVTVFTAQWTANKFTVTFQSGANGTMQGDASVKVNYNSSIEAGKVPTITAKTGYVFIGWENNGNVYTNEAVASFKVTSNVTFTARYENISKAIAIFDYNGGKDADGKSSITMTGIAGEEITVKAPTREGYTFAGWDKTDLKYGVAGSVTVFTAQWTANKHAVTFVVGDDTKGEMDGDASVQVDHNGSVEANKVPTITAKTGYVFIGWSDGTSTYAAEAIKNYKVTADVTFTAQYEADSKAVVIFDFNGGKDADDKSSISMSGDANATINNMDAPTRDGYTFAGWKNGEQDVTNLVFGAAGTVTVYTAQWTVNKHSVTFNAGNNGSMTGNDSVEVDHNGSVAAEKVPTITANEGFVFVGWSDGTSVFAKEAIQNYKVTANVTFTAQYEDVASKAFAIFDYAGGKDNNGKSSIMMTGTAGAAITIADPTRTGYTFAGWKKGEATSQNPTFGAAGSVTTYTAVWTADPDKTVKVNFVVDATKGDVTGTTEFDVVSGSFLTEVPTVNAKDGYTFIGWSDGKNTYFTSGVKLYAITGATTFTALFEKADNNNPNPPAKDTLTVSGNATAKRGDKVNFKALLNGKETGNVTWTVTGGKTSTTISDAGVLTVGSLETNGTILTITATSKSDSTLTASTFLVVLVDSGNTGGGSSGGSGGGGTVTASYTITASAGKGGIISPDGTIKVSRGDNKTFTITAGNGYIIADVLVDGVSVGAVSSYTFEKVSKDHTISVSFKEARPGVADPSETGVDQWLRVTDHIAYMHGYDNGQFGSLDNLTRAQAAQLFYRLLVNQDVDITVSFTDVPADAWYAKAVNTLASLGIIKGIGSGKFDPDREISRAEFIVIATRFAKVTDKISSPFVDVADDAWYAPYVTTATSYGWITGVGESRFAPDDLVTRAEAATIVNRMLARSADREFVDGNAVQHFSDVTPDAWYYYQIMEAANGHSHRYSEDGYEVWNGLN